jgi:hypothetical protein
VLRLLIALCLPLQGQEAAAIRLYPFDNTARDSGFRSYVGKLRAAVESRDTDALRKLVDEGVVVGPADGDKGWAKFVAKWRPDDRRNSRLWSALADLLSLGFIREHPQLFLSPYLVWRFPAELNMATHLVVIRDKAVLRQAPSINAPPAASLSFDVVRRLGDVDSGDELIKWVHVRTLNGQTGYLNTRDVMSPLMPRAQFGLRRGRWTMIALEDPGQ